VSGPDDPEITIGDGQAEYEAPQYGRSLVDPLRSFITIVYPRIE